MIKHGRKVRIPRPRNYAYNHLDDKYFEGKTIDEVRAAAGLRLKDEQAPELTAEQLAAAKRERTARLRAATLAKNKEKIRLRLEGRDKNEDEIGESEGDGRLLYSKWQSTSLSSDAASTRIRDGAGSDSSDGSRNTGRGRAIRESGSSSANTKGTATIDVAQTMIFTCAHCNQSFDSHNKLGGHVRWCSKNPANKGGAPLTKPQKARPRTRSRSIGGGSGNGRGRGSSRPAGSSAGNHNSSRSSNSNNKNSYYSNYNHNPARSGGFYDDDILRFRALREEARARNTRRSGRPYSRSFETSSNGSGGSGGSSRSRGKGKRSKKKCKSSGGAALAKLAVGRRLSLNWEHGGVFYDGEVVVRRALLFLLPFASAPNPPFPLFLPFFPFSFRYCTVHCAYCARCIYYSTPALLSDIRSLSRRNQ